MELINRYFPGISAHQLHQFDLLGKLYPEWNLRINVISRKDIENLYERHILHSLGIAKVINFTPGTKILDAGTGGGFPGIPLAILFPEAQFHLIDSTAKKLSVVQNIAADTGLKNVTTEHNRLEDHLGNYDFVVSRAVTSLPEFCSLVLHFISGNNQNAITNGILYLKGGDIKEELQRLAAWGQGGRGAGRQGSGEAWKHNIYPLSDFFAEPYFITKSLIHLF